ncbi:MAG TPA: DUF2520 domain-containing protein [Firmicutes bacterium]|nr:DUF2520 domain-containing protein [Bacillota bacterium]
MKKIAIIGAGNVGKVLGYALQKKGYTITGVVCQTKISGKEAADLLYCNFYHLPEIAAREADIVFLTTPDRVIENVCLQIAAGGGFREGQIVLHTSGAHSSKILSPAREEGAYTLSFHPLQTFPALEEGLRSLPGTFFAVEGDEEGYPQSLELVKALGGKLFFVPTEMKELYHAAACIACNYLVSLMDMALQCFALMDLPSGEAFEALLPLIQSTLANIGEIGPEKALTGPIARGDFSTINAHLAKMKALFPEIVSIYSQMGLYTAKLAVRKGTLKEAEKEKFKTLLQGGYHSE